MRFAQRGRSGQLVSRFVELMITVSIMAILVAIVVATMYVSTTRAKESSCKANLRTLVDAIQSYRSLHGGANPATLDDLVPDFIKSSFKWVCPAGPYGSNTADYRDNYNSAAGEVTCPHPGHSL